MSQRALENVLQQCRDVELSFPRQPEGSTLFSGTKRGTLFLTSYRVLFVTSHTVSDPMLSFMMPFNLMKDCSVEQPIFAPNFIKGTIMAAPDGGWEGQAMFKLSFRKGGAIQFAQLMTKAASAAARGAPLRTINYWYGPPGMYVVVSGQGNMMCTPQTPCAAVPVVIYGAPPAGYGALPPRYDAPLPGYGAPPLVYQASPAGYQAPPGGYQAPPPGYQAPPAGYQAPPMGYEAPPGGYQGPPPGYQAAPVGYEAPPGGYQAPPMGYEAQPEGYGAPPAGNVASQSPGNEASHPSTSSSQAHSPPSKK
ncbi:postacrosomal sheath WW domain-binding protein [Choloepus didactylus]|uniref:postacrosomal sheath WW domain-binding protein n=1 Tax=Choloepus didactylus TaxID=27675 RepID=UPI00189D5BDA|nr:postacrosomal sheath WW domain-binding protein [Choloepus didactylus]